MTRYGWIGLAVSFILLWSCCACLWGRPTTAQEAERVVAGWLKADPTPLGTSFGRHVRKVDTFTDGSGEPLYYIVYLQPSGFAIISADDLVEPIIGFVQGDRFDASPENPLGALVTADLTRRIAAVRTGSAVRIMAEESFERDTQTKWRHLMDLAEGPKDRVVATALGIPSISDVRVAPLVKSKWDQCTVTSCDPVTVQKCPLPCYNYYTPGNYPCGCPATALAQLMRHHEYPTTGIGVHEFQIRVDGVTQMASTRGRDGLGGAYNWDLMPYEPNCSTPEAQRRAVGALCCDAGVSMNQGYSANGSGWPGCTVARVKQALTTTFMYGNAIHGYNSESVIGRGLIGMINANLDAKKPVVLGTTIHAFVCDGYGYSNSTLYHHLNMGWSGLCDLWYDLTSSITTPPLDQGIVCSCVYNVQTLRAGDGEIISGRVLDQSGEPIASAVVYAKSGGEIMGETETDSEGIYAFDYMQSDTTYTVNAVLKGYGFNMQKVAIGLSKDNSITSGNIWGADFVGLLGDFNGDQIVDMRDLSMLAQYWEQDESSVDIAPRPSCDHIVGYEDLALFAGYWLKEVEAREAMDVALLAHWKLDEADGVVAADSTGANDGTLVGNPLWQPAGGKLGGALQLDGIDDYVRTPFVADPGKQAFSVFAWVKGGGPGQVIVSQTDWANWLMAGAATGELTTELKEFGRTGKSLASAVVITDGTWHRVGLSWDGSNRILYVDDVEVAKDTQAELRSSSGGLYIGAGKNLGATTFWSGLIDDVRVYDRAVKP